jgi:hypothetical protein
LGLKPGRPGCAAAVQEHFKGISCCMARVFALCAWKHLMDDMSAGRLIDPDSMANKRHQFSGGDLQQLAATFFLWFQKAPEQLSRFSSAYFILPII